MSKKQHSERPTRRRPALSPAMEDYLRAIWDLGGGLDGDPVATTALARRLTVAPASVTGMLKRLHGLGLVRHERYAGVRLSEAGEGIALEVIRHHRIIETYLAEALGVGWDEVHDEAHRLEHHISDALGERMAEALGHPARDPHGAPIPPRDGPFERPRWMALSDAPVGVPLIVRAVEDEDADVLRRLAQLGLRPDVHVQIEAGEREGVSVPGRLRIRLEEDAEGVDVPLELAAAVNVARIKPGS